MANCSRTNICFDVSPNELQSMVVKHDELNMN
jgi:hypothetical protein